MAYGRHPVIMPSRFDGVRCLSMFNSVVPQAGVGIGTNGPARLSFGPKLLVGVGRLPPHQAGRAGKFQRDHRRRQQARRGQGGG
jgi:hypothetical protein